MIHSTAVVDPRAELAPDVTIGPYVVIEGRCILQHGVAIHAHSIVRGRCIIGGNCTIGPHSLIGMPPQQQRFRGGETSCVIGPETVIREGASVHLATKAGDENATHVGSRCFLMGNSHVGHDCQVGNSVTLAHGAMLGGHCQVADHVIIGGGAGIHQFCRIGRAAIIGGIELVTRDVPPFATVRYGGLKAYNAVGCRRLELSDEVRRAIRQAYQCLHKHRTIPAAVRAIQASTPPCAQVQEILDFIAETRRGIQPSIHFVAQMATGASRAQGE